MKGRKICMREKEIKVLAVKPHEYPKEFILKKKVEYVERIVE